MALDFPSSPAVNDTYTSGGRTWRWNGTAWVGATPYSGQATITGGTINNTAIGGTTPAAGAFTTVSASGNILSSAGAVGYSSGATIYTIGSGGYNGPVGGSTPAAGAFTTLAASPTGNSIQFQGSDGIIYRSGGTGTNAGFHRFRYFDTDVAVVSSTGLAVKGGLTVSSSVEALLTLVDTDASNTNAVFGHNGGATNYVSRNGASNGTHVFYGYDGTTYSTFASISSTGLAVTGGGSFTGMVDITAVATPAFRIGSGTTRIEMGYSAGLTGNYLESLNPSGGSVDMLYYMGGANTHKFYTSGALRLAISDTGTNVTSGSFFVYGYGGAAQSSVIWQRSDQTSYIYHNGTNTIHRVGGTDTLTISSTGLAVTGSISAQFLDIGQSGAQVANFNRGTSDGSLIGFYRSGSEVGTISVTTTATAYNTSSDARLKTNIRDYDGYDSGVVIDRILPRIFDWKTGEKDSIGFIAQELHAAYPQAVTKGDDGEKITREWGVDFSKLVPVLVAELKALRARVAQLENK